MTEAHGSRDGLRIGLVGYGGAGRGIHARLLREAGMAVHDVVVRDPARRAAAAADWPDAGLHDSLEQMLDATALDLRLNALADTVCPADPRTRDQRRADAMGTLAHGADCLACLCDTDDCPATDTPPGL